MKQGIHTVIFKVHDSCVRCRCMCIYILTHTGLNSKKWDFWKC